MGVLERLPLLDIRVDVTPSSGEPGAVAPSDEAMVTVHIKRRGRSSQHAYSPAFPKEVDESWFILLGDVEHEEVLALKRVGAIRGAATTATVTFVAPETPGKYKYTVYIVSQTYVGLDQQYEVEFEVAEGAEA
jgi:hypothetical protein